MPLSRRIPSFAYSFQGFEPLIMKSIGARGFEELVGHLVSVALHKLDLGISLREKRFLNSKLERQAMSINGAHK